MTAAERYVRAIRRLNHAGLLRLWGQITGATTPGWSPGKAFEYLVLRAFELEKVDVRYPYSVQLSSGINEQIDGVIYANCITALIEAKDRGAMNIESIAKLRNQLQRRPAGTIGVVFSRGGFTPPTFALAQHLAPQIVLLWDGNEFEIALGKQKVSAGLTIKYRAAVEYGIPDSNLAKPGVL